MSPQQLVRTVAFAMLAIGALLALSEWIKPQPVPLRHMARGAEEIRELLEGTWLREYSDQGVNVRRLLTLTADGGFREHVHAVDAAGKVRQHAHEGTWLYDGTNLKRKYVLVDGKPPSRLNLPFATFQITFESRNDFRGVDNIHGNFIHYRRVSPETQL